MAKKTRAVKQRDQMAIRSAVDDFPAVGIGASAGGLNAFEEFFLAMPADSGMAFILVSHLDPGQASILPELVQKKTGMKVFQAADKMPAPNLPDLEQCDSGAGRYLFERMVRLPRTIEMKWLRLDGEPVELVISAAPIFFRKKDGACFFLREKL